MEPIHGVRIRLVSDGQTGLLVASADVEALALALDRLSRDGALRQNISINAAAHAKRDFSLERMIDRYLEVFDELVEERVEVAPAPRHVEQPLRAM